MKFKFCSFKTKFAIANKFTFKSELKSSSILLYENLSNNLVKKFSFPTLFKILSTTSSKIILEFNCT